jgi:glycosyltransferase involved in cell wall biosynthesis
MLTAAHLTASPFYGGPERQMIGLAEHLRPDVRTVFLSFAEGGNARAFLEEAARRGFEALVLDQDTPHLRAAMRELVAWLHRLAADVLFCHGYKAGILGRVAARRAGIPVVGVSRGWTYESLKIRAYELLDRVNLRWMDRVVCVSQAQAAKVRRVGIPAQKIVVIPNAIDAARFHEPDPAARRELESLFAARVSHIVGAAGRLSPEKGFSVLIDAAALVNRERPDTGFVLFGDGSQRGFLAQRIAARGLAGRFVLAGFRRDLDRLLPHLDLLVQSSYTEGMPNVVLEACAAGVPVVATAVGGTEEILRPGAGGVLVPAGDAPALYHGIQSLLADESLRHGFRSRAWPNACETFSFEHQGRQYRDLLEDVLGTGRGGRPRPAAKPVPFSNSHREHNLPARNPSFLKGTARR